MFTTCGIGIISKDDEIIERAFNLTTYFNLVLISKDPFQNKRHYYKVNISVPPEVLQEARESLLPGRPLQVRIGELNGWRSDKGYISVDIKTRWQWVEVLKALPGKERKEE